VSGSADGTGSAARFNNPSGVAVDSAGNVYVADGDNSTIRKVTAAGVVNTLAGSAGETGSTDGTGSAARFFYPNGVAVDSEGSVYVSDGDSNTIRKVTAAGVVSTLAGSAGVSGSADGTGSAARFNNPTGVMVDSAGNVYVADQFNHTIRMVTSAGVVSTIGGVAGQFGHAIGYASVAGFYKPSGISLSPSGVIYVTDSNHRVVQGQQLSGFQPVLTLGGISALSTTGATLNGTVNPNGFVTTAQFEYGTTTSYGSTAAVTLSANSGTTAQNVSASLTGLTPNTVYYYRLSAVNVDGTQTTLGGMFTTTLSSNANLSALALNSGTLSPVFASGTVSYTASVGNAVNSITVTPTLADASGSVQVRSNGGTYASVISGSASGALALNSGSNTVDVRVTAQDGVTQKTYTVAVARGAATPTVDSPEAESISATGASLGGNVISDGGAEITERGVVYSVTASNGNPLIGGAGVTKVTASGTTGQFTAAVTGLVQETDYSFRAYATNSQGTSYTSVGSFTALTFHQSWRKAHFGSFANSGQAADDADPDSDGIPNLLERALNLPPNAASRVSENLRTAGGNLEYTYTRGSAAHHSGTTFQVEWSDDLTTWSTAGVGESLVSDDGAHQQVRATISAGSSRRFVRLRVR
ncbi:NHL domain-containing protein, partial [Prosthecobacter vanneervenii]|uniref:NHL domain-containing protein n=1 Tax=Prosthecobacter vanneervenii TaxID=48466 RepID=UPI001614DAF1